MKVGSLIAFILAVFAGINLAVSYANGSIKGIVVSIGLYVLAYWLHYQAINGKQKA